MGISCQIIRKGNEVERVFNPNGSDSELYKSALSEVNDPSIALKVWATAYTPEFKLYYGDWTLDTKEEPSLSDVKEFLEARQGIAPPMTDQDINDLRTIMIGTGIKAAGELSSALDPFIRRGSVEVNRDTLMSSGLFTVDEVNYILSNPEAMNSLRDLVAKFNNVMLHGMDARTTYLLTNDYDGDIFFDSNVYTSSGKKQYISPAKINDELRSRVGGIKSRSEFDAAMSSFPYESVSERYFSDIEYADRLFGEYSSFTRLNVVDTLGRPVENSGRYGLLSSDVVYNEDIAIEMLEDMNALVNMPSEVWDDEVLVKEGLKKIALAGADMGIDLTRLESQYYNKTKEEFDDFLLGLDVYVRSLKPGRPVDAFFPEDYDRFFGNQGVKQDLAVLKPEEEKLNVSIVEPEVGVSDIDIYNDASMIHLHDNVYQKVNKLPKEQLYDTLYEMSMIDERILPKDAYPGNSGKAKGHTKDAVIQSLKEYVSGYIDFNQSEEIALNKLIFGHELITEAVEVSDIQRELNRYVERRNRNDSMNAYSLRSRLLRSRIQTPQIYDNILYNIVYRNGNFSLKNSDPMTLKELELMMPEGLMDDMYSYAMQSKDPTMKDLFFIENYPDIYKSVDFYQYYYRNNPGTIENYSLPYIEMEPGRIKTSSFDDIIRIGDMIYQKVAEDGGAGVYDAIAGIKDHEVGVNLKEVNIKSEAEILKQYDRGIENDADMVVYDDYGKGNEIEEMKNLRTC